MRSRLVLVGVRWQTEKVRSRAVTINIAGVKGLSVRWGCLNLTVVATQTHYIDAATLPLIIRAITTNHREKSRPSHTPLSKRTFSFRLKLAKKSIRRWTS
jgi:hypothetical protein